MTQNSKFLCLLLTLFFCILFINEQTACASKRTLPLEEQTEESPVKLRCLEKNNHQTSIKMSLKFLCDQITTSNNLLKRSQVIIKEEPVVQQPLSPISPRFDFFDQNEESITPTSYSPIQFLEDQPCDDFVLRYTIDSDYFPELSRVIDPFIK